MGLWYSFEISIEIPRRWVGVDGEIEVDRAHADAVDEIVLRLRSGEWGE